jgi:hypothetical protein
MKRYAYVAALLVLAASITSGQVIYNNGPYVTHATGGGVAGLDPLSSLQTNLGLATFGPTSGGTFRLADDFTVPCGEQWTLNSIKVFAYITQAAAPFNTTSPFTSANYRIWSGKPGAGGVIIHDHSAANQLTSTAWAGSYRVTNTTFTNLQRPVMALNMNGNAIVLNPGTYWLDYQTGPTGFSPFQSVLGQPNTGNSIQFIALAASWNSVLADAGFTQGLPFEIDHAAPVQVPCFKFDITQPGGPGNSVIVADTGGTPGNTFVNVITLAAGSFPNGWLYGVDISIPELTSALNSGPPFVGTLDFAGNFILPPIPVGGLPVPINVYYVGIELNGSTVVSHDAAKTVTISP